MATDCGRPDQKETTDLVHWQAHNKSFMARNFPPLDKDGRPLLKPIKPQCNFTLMQDSDYKGEVARNEHEARKYAGM